MASLAILDDITRTLEQDANFIRMKKLMFCAYQGKWAKTSGELDRFNLREAIEGLCVAAASFHELELLFEQIVSKVNKKSEYETVAKTILNQLERFYLKPDGTTFSEKGQSEANVVSLPTVYSSPDSETLSRIHPQLSTQFPVIQDLFDVRQKILQRTNPLRAKILVFSCLEREFVFSERDWSVLRTRELDTLLRRLLHSYPNITDLETKLYHTARSLDKPDEYAQVAQVILKVLAPVYPAAATQMLTLNTISPPISMATESSDSSSSSSSSNSSDSRDDEGYFHTGEITQLAPRVPVNFFDVTPAPSPSIPKPPAPQFTPEEEDEETAALSSNPPTPTRSSEVDSDLSAFGLHIFKLIKQNLSLEEEMQEFIDQGVTTVMYSLEAQFKNLEVTLNRRLAGEPVERQLLKYKCLRDFIDEFKTRSQKLIQTLEQLETKERQRLNVPAKTEKSDPATKLLELAKQGNPKAIAAFLAPPLQAKGIKLTVFVKEDCLHIIVEGATIPDSKLLLPFVQKKIASLNSPNLPLIKLHGRQSGKKSVAWTQKLEV
mgnify:CR=1 FL=1